MIGLLITLALDLQLSYLWSVQHMKKWLKKDVQ